MKYFIAGGAGFIGSELAKMLLFIEPNCNVTVYDNLSSGNIDLITPLKNNPRFRFVLGDIKDINLLIHAMYGCDVVYHFASNADIAKAINNPTIDFYEGTLLTQNILEAMRINGIKKIVYASGSGIYGDTGYKWIYETYSPLIPISTYGASKLAGEALISAYCHMFDMEGVVYRFANVIGKNSTHGVIKDFIEKLNKNPHSLKIMGNGEQLKGYMHVSDILLGIDITFTKCEKPFDYFNLAPNDQITVNEIASLVEQEMGLQNVKHLYDSAMRGWKGDVPIVKMNSDKARGYGWNPYYSTSKAAVEKTIKESLENVRKNDVS